MGFLDDIQNAVESAGSRAIDSVQSMVTGDVNTSLTKIADDPRGSLTALQVEAGRLANPPKPVPPTNTVLQAGAQVANQIVANAGLAGLSVGTLGVVALVAFLIFRKGK